ncbi:MAG TPA: helix-turn-helix domain-containing protein [Nocardioides sp.]|nr:TetR/AcrR family transcriptional regulator [uncultured Nocardioides sp.]HEX5986734.1 helix-turn-helix domain-containing protein [Nocardioides sp.]
MAEARRPYRSTLREEQARATRRAIVEAGAALFVERGFAGTTVDAIAERAGVSRKTVFTSVGGKVAVLKDAFDWALAGDDAPVPLGDRPAVRDFLTETDPATAVEKWARVMSEIAGRLAYIHPALVAAADVDPEAAELNETSERNRLHGARTFVRHLREVGGLREDVSVKRGAAVAALLMDPLGYRRLVLGDGWREKEYAAWVARMAAASLLRE